MLVKNLVLWDLLVGPSTDDLLLILLLWPVQGKDHSSRCEISVQNKVLISTDLLMLHAVIVLHSYDTLALPSVRSFFIELLTQLETDFAIFERTHCFDFNFVTLLRDLSRWLQGSSHFPYNQTNTNSLHVLVEVLAVSELILSSDAVHFEKIGEDLWLLGFS